MGLAGHTNMMVTSKSKEFLDTCIYSAFISCV